MIDAIEDARIPLRFAAAGMANPGEALLIEDGMAGAAPGQVVARFARGGGGHWPGCACCAGRGAAAVALGTLFQSRALGRVAWFTGVVAVVADPSAIAAEVQGDRLVAARFRLVR